MFYDVLIVTRGTMVDYTATSLRIYELHHNYTYDLLLRVRKKTKKGESKIMGNLAVADRSHKENLNWN